MRRDANGDDGRRRDDTRYRWMQFIMSLNEQRASFPPVPTMERVAKFERALNSTKYKGQTTGSNKVAATWRLI